MLSTIAFSDLSEQKRWSTSLDAELTAEHRVDQAVDHYLTHMNIPREGLRWRAFSRGVLLDGKSRLGELSDVDTAWTIMPEVSAG